MKIKDWFIAKKQKRMARKLAREQEKVERKIGMDLPELEDLDVDPDDIQPPESRFTEEYREFLKRQEAEMAERAYEEAQAVTGFEKDRNITGIEVEKD